jgi:hypothetical protein
MYYSHIFQNCEFTFAFELSLFYVRKILVNFLPPNWLFFEGPYTNSEKIRSRRSENLDKTKNQKQRFSERTNVQLLEVYVPDMSLSQVYLNMQKLFL